ncbi:Helicase-like transcription factor [Colletotrichum tanaceti]|uniref:Helicase-like transcription factor n=1 Tax=Colletotrichum tanaceti TaxID=1306861 RepID=A0A4U6XI76_9PEZI|nr:Helicase-like transcription factor [Colletotrichum tanaceti]TKW55565.1 Helicase-like transcription factor [Colletotrichum tanaceti]
MMPPGKRGLPVIDLVSSDDDSAPRPSKRVSGNRAVSLGSQAGARAFRAAPSNTQPFASFGAIPGSSSQPHTYYDTDEELIDLTQAPDGPPRELYGTLDNKIVGVRYYNGYASPGELVICLREPNNQYDRNAIRVCNVIGVQIGHLPRKVVEKLAPYVDRDEIAIEAVLTGEKGMFDCPIRLHIYGTSNPINRLALEEKLKRDKLIKAGELKKTRAEAEAQRKVLGIKGSQSTIGLDGGTAEPEVSLEELAQASQTVQDQHRGDAIKSFVVDEDFLTKMAMAEQPAVLESTLLPYQLQGLAWMAAKENPQLPTKGSQESIQLWKWDQRGRGMYNLATNFLVSTPPKLLSGGILADEMGLGKTLQVISLILTGGPGPTLIVAPVSVMSNWEQQIRRHVKQEHLPKIFTYHGNNKATKSELARYQVVITSYNKLATEGGKDKIETPLGPLMATDWRRVVLDEGHVIRNAKTKAAVAARRLKAQSRWVLTGTPIINNIKDFQSLLQFLSITGGVEQPAIFTTVISRPLAQGNGTAETLLQLLMRDLCLRRKKDMKFVDLKLPPKKEYVHRIAFRPDEKNKYEALLSEAQLALKDYQNNTSGMKGQFQNVLERLLRLRQVCNHWTLCRKRIDDLLAALEGQSVVALNSENIKILQEALRLYIETQEDCAICLDTLHKPVITHCKHVFCRACISKVIETQHKCPMCRNQLQEDALLEPAPEVSEEEEESFDDDAKSSKTEALLKILQATTKDPKSKVIIFSQWTSFLTIIQNQLIEAGYKFTRVDGSMTAPKRDAAIHALDHDPDTRVMLASLAVCSVGLNLVSADTVILADSWWAPAIEDQAIDRVHRLGQKRPTTVWRLVMEETVEERVLDIQHEKRTLVGKAFQEKNKGKKTQETRMADIQKLLG